MVLPLRKRRALRTMKANEDEHRKHISGQSLAWSGRLFSPVLAILRLGLRVDAAARERRGLFHSQGVRSVASSQRSSPQ